MVKKCQVFDGTFRGTHMTFSEIQDFEPAAIKLGIGILPNFLHYLQFKKYFPIGEIL